MKSDPDLRTPEAIRTRDGQHVRVAQTLNGLYFSWSKYQKRGYVPRHAKAPEVPAWLKH